MVLIALGIAGALAVPVCCGGFMWAGYYFNDAVSEDPTVVAELTEEIAQLDIPDDLEPAFCMNATVPFTGEPLGVWVVYVDETTDSMLVLTSLGDVLEPSAQDQEDFWKRMEDSLQQQGVEQKRNVSEWDRMEKEIKEIVVRGQPATFHFARGGEEGLQEQHIDVYGFFEGENGQVLFRFNGDAEKYDEETIVEMLESVR